ncbi:MAG: ribosome silencing factor [Clostridia bacterium]|nr:ribosome silencing factor [Clostridia bacterium]
MNALEKASKIKEILDSKKALNIEVLNVDEKTTLAEYFVIATGTSITHIRSLAGEVEEKMEELSIKPNNFEGKMSDSWMILDYGSVIVNIFSPDAREYYELDKLWK